MPSYTADLTITKDRVNAAIEITPSFATAPVIYLYAYEVNLIPSKGRTTTLSALVEWDRGRRQFNERWGAFSERGSQRGRTLQRVTDAMAVTLSTSQGQPSLNSDTRYSTVHIGVPTSSFPEGHELRGKLTWGVRQTVVDLNNNVVSESACLGKSPSKSD